MRKEDKEKGSRIEEVLDGNSHQVGRGRDVQSD
jgi:hypothetical protein